MHVRPGVDDAAAVLDFLKQHRIRTLNVAGPRASGDPGIYEYVLAVLERLGAIG
ncbi:MAG: YpsA SLOG family protein [Burkholderiales bacterium]